MMSVNFNSLKTVLASSCHQSRENNWSNTSKTSDPLSLSRSASTHAVYVSTFITPMIRSHIQHHRCSAITVNWWSGRSYKVAQRENFVMQIEQTKSIHCRLWHVLFVHLSALGEYHTAQSYIIFAQLDSVESSLNRRISSLFVHKSEVHHHITHVTYTQFCDQSRQHPYHI